MRFFRIAKAAYNTPASAFSGMGASKTNHRWSWGHPDTRAVYCSDSLALACLECLVHIRPLPKKLPQSIYYTIDIPDNLLETIKPNEIPKGWNNPIATPKTRNHGTKFLENQRNVGLIVPTAIVPNGNNVIINPKHPKFSIQWVSKSIPFIFDTRLE